MKLPVRILGLAMTLAITLSGCGSKSGVDTSGLQKNFASAEAASKTAVDKAVALIKDEKYADALASLQEAAAKAKLTPAQASAVKDVIAQLQKAIAEAAAKSAEGATKAVSDLQKSLPK